MPPTSRRWSTAVSASLLRTEALRVAARSSPECVRDTRRALRDIAFVDLDWALLDHAGILGPPHLRSLDAVHLTAALSLGDDLDELVTYDARLAAAAATAGLFVSRAA